MCFSILMRVAAAATPPPPPLVYVFVEGNIGAGKSTLLALLEEPLRRALRERAGDGALLAVVPEPVHAWQRVPDGDGGGHLNLLDAFYADPPRHAFAFQAHALVTRVDAVHAAAAAALAAAGASPSLLVLLCERSVYTDRGVFVRALAQRGALTPLERAVYAAWHASWCTRLLPARHAVVAYLDVPPDECARRVRERARGEERALPLEYLELLHRLHGEALAQHDTLWPGAARFTVPSYALHDAAAPARLAHDMCSAILAPPS